MKNFILLPVLLLTFPISLKGQNEMPLRKEATNAIYINKNEAGIEVGGSGIFYNIFYQQYITRISNNKSLNLRIGGSVFPLSNMYRGSRIGYNLTLTPNVLFFAKRHAWETGLGLSYLDRTSYNEYVNNQGQDVDAIFRQLFLSPQASYRYYFSKSPLYIRGSVLLHIALREYDNYGGHSLRDHFVYPWIGISGGIRF